MSAGSAGDRLQDGSELPSDPRLQRSLREDQLGHLAHLRIDARRSGVLLGTNIQGELGAPTTTSCGNVAIKCSPRPVPVVCPPGAPCKFTWISAGETLTAAVDVNGDVWWWGRGAPDHHRVNAVLANSPVKFSVVAAGFGHSCAISQSRSEIWCWGTNAYGEAGAPPLNPIEVPDTAPIRVLAPFKFNRIAAGGEHTCAVGQTGTDVVCWGRNDSNQTRGPNSTQFPAGTGQFFFQQFGGLVSISDVTASPTSTCVNVNIGVKCWGANTFFNPTGFGVPDKVTVGGQHLCATTNQQASCLGTNVWGVLGTGSIVSSNAPVPVLAPPPLYSDISAGANHTCGVTPDGDAFCWGNNFSGQIGSGAYSVTPVKEPKKVVAP